MLVYRLSKTDLNDGNYKNAVKEELHASSSKKQIDLVVKVILEMMKK